MRYLADALIAEQDFLHGGCVWYSRYGLDRCCLHDGVLLEC